MQTLHAFHTKIDTTQVIGVVVVVIVVIKTLSLEVIIIEG